MNFIDRRNKFQILQERANLYNNIQDQLYDQQQPEEEKNKQINDKLNEFTVSQLQRLDQKQYNPNSTMCSSMVKPPVSVLTTSAMISLGLGQYQSMTTQGQDFNRNADNQFNQYKELKKNGLPDPYLIAQKKAKDDNNKRQQILFKTDHLKEFEDVSHQGFKQHQSDYRNEYKVTNDTQEYLRNQDKRNNLQKNDLNTFFDVYLKHKSTLRK